MDSVCPLTTQSFMDLQASNLAGRLGTVIGSNGDSGYLGLFHLRSPSS